MVINMANINGIYFFLEQQLEQMSNVLQKVSCYPYYKAGLEFDKKESLMEYFEKKGNKGDSESYLFKAPESVELKSEVERYVLGKIGDKSLFFNESNSAHHLTYFLVNAVARKSTEHPDFEKILVINFDQHEDFGGLGKLFCGNWGSQLHALGCGYMAVGCKRMNKSNNKYIKSWKSGDRKSVV